MNILTNGTSENAGTGNQYFDTDFHKMSHELRTPLNHINGFAELLLMDEGLNPAHADYVRAILTGSEALNAAVIAFLDRAEAPTPNPAAASNRKALSNLQHGWRRSTFRRRAESPRNFRRFERVEPA